MELPTSEPRNFVLQLRQALMGSQALRARDCHAWDCLFYAGAQPDKDTPSIANIVHSRVTTEAGNLFSPENLSFRLEYPPGTPDEALQAGQVAGDEISYKLREADADLEFGDAVELALRHGSAFGQLQWEQEGKLPGHFSCDVIQQSAVGVLNERAKSLADQPAFMISYTVPASEFKHAILQFRGTHDIASAFDSKEGDAATQMNDATRVVLGLNQPISSGSSSQAGYVNLMPRAPYIPSANSRGRQVAVDVIWIHRDDGRWATVYVVEGNETIGTDRWRNFLALEPSGNENRILAKRHPYFYVCPHPVKGSFFGRSRIADIAEGQDFVRRHLDGMDDVLSRQEDPSYVGFGAVNTAEMYRQQLRQPGGFLQEPSQGAKVEPFVPQMPAQMFDALTVVTEFTADAANAPPVVQGRGEQGVRAQGHAETLMMAASSRARRPSFRTIRQCGDMGDIALDILRVKDATLAGRLGKNFLLEQLPDGFHVYCNGHTASPLFAAEFNATVAELFKAGVIGPEELLDLVHPVGHDLLKNALQKRQQAQAKFIQEHPEVVTKMTAHKR